MKVYYKILKDKKLQGVAFCDEKLWNTKKQILKNEGFVVIILSKQEFNEIFNNGI